MNLKNELKNNKILDIIDDEQNKLKFIYEKNNQKYSLIFGYSDLGYYIEDIHQLDFSKKLISLKKKIKEYFLNSYFCKDYELEKNSITKQYTRIG